MKLTPKAKLARKAPCYHATWQIGCFGTINMDKQRIRSDGINEIRTYFVPIGVKPVDYMCAFDRYLFDITIDRYNP